MNMTENDISYKIIGTCIDLHKNLGPGLLESVYENALAYDLRELGFSVNTQPLPVIYKENRLEIGFRIDIIVDNKVLIEVKSIEALAPVHFAQTLTYLKLSGLKLGLLINFNSMKVKDSVHRIVNNL
jgi:GxxExxY protein